MASGQDPVNIPPQYSAVGMNNLVPVISQTTVEQIYVGAYALTYKKTASLWIGSILIACGALSIIGGTLAIAFYADFYYVGTGLWVGSIVVTAGSVSLAAAHYPVPCLVHAATAFAFISMGFSVIQMILSSVGLASQCSSCYYTQEEALAANGLMIFSAAVAAIVSLCLGIINSQTVCNCSCCGDSTDQVVCVPVPCAPAPSGQFSGEPAVYYNYMNPGQQYHSQPMYQLSAYGIQPQQVMPKHLIMTQVPASTNSQAGANGQV